MNTRIAAALLAFLAAPLAAQAHDRDNDHDALAKPVNCGNCAKWNAEQQAFKVVGNTWYVGPAGLSAVLVTGPKGHVLLDGALPQSAKQIEARIEALGFKVRDIKYILVSHPHWDHAGGVPVLARDSGATVVASAQAAQVLRNGVIGSDDPQYEDGNVTHLPKLENVKVLADGETLHLGPLAITAHMTPGHTPGGASYTWQSCEGKRCLNVAYVDSLNPASREGYFFSGDATTPDITPAFAASIAKVGALKCDVVLSVHPDFTDMAEKLAARTGAHNSFIDPNGCKAYAADARARLDKRLDTERQQKEKAAQAPAK
jgi:metallo-beta-lactamase class B